CYAVSFGFASYLMWWLDIAYCLYSLVNYVYYHKLYNCCALILYRIFCMPTKKLHHVYQQYDHEIALPLGPGVFVRSQASYLFYFGDIPF
ncbi:hypothetical protein ACJX0J_042331, partial [Zea mays]